MKKYEVKRDFWVGDCNVQLKKGDEVKFDDKSSKLVIDGDKHEARNLKAAIKAEWLVPVDGEYPELDGPLGETEAEAVDRRRKERFAAKAKRQGENPNVVQRDAREVGVINEESELFEKVLDAEPVASARGKKKYEVIEDDTQEVAVAKVNDSETKAIKKALNQEKGEKKSPKEFKVFTDHYDADAIQVGKYSDDSRESTIKGWSKLHWTKKAEVIKTAEDKKFLNQLKGLETSKKIIQRIDKKLEELQ